MLPLDQVMPVMVQCRSLYQVKSPRRRRSIRLIPDHHFASCTAACSHIEGSARSPRDYGSVVAIRRIAGVD